jgi:predicted NUDIX family NTP pyrophosphohydrolase
MAPPTRGKEASGTVLCRRARARADGELEILLVHPSGNYNRRAPWGIPKGQPEPGETLEEAARRETREETGIVAGPLVGIGHVDYTRSRKRVWGFAGQAPPAQAPSCASWEVDKVEFIAISRARRIIHPDQAAFLDRLEQLLAAGGMPEDTSPVTPAPES